MLLSEVAAVQAECLADDIPIEPEMLSWSMAEVTAFFESGGAERPLAPPAAARAPAFAAEGAVALPDSGPAHALESAPPAAGPACDSAAAAQPPDPLVDPLVEAAPAPTAPPESAAAGAVLIEEPAEPRAEENEERESVGDLEDAGEPYGSGVEGLRPLQWANCELLQEVVRLVLPDTELAPDGILMLDISTTQLVKLGDYDQQCEALLNGPQCAGMRGRLKQAELVLALINDNDDADVALGGGHWSAAAWRRSSWRDGIFILEHYDPSGDIEINADAAGLFGASIAERLSEVSSGADLERTEIWRMRAPLQHDRASCGLTSVAFLQALVDDHRQARRATSHNLGLAETPPRWSGPPRTPDRVLNVDWAAVEALRRRAAEALAPELLGEIRHYCEQLATARAAPAAAGGATGGGLGRRVGGEGAAEAPNLAPAGLHGGVGGDAPSWAAGARLCSQRCEVVFDAYEDDGEAFECESDSDSVGQAGGEHAPPGIAGSAAAADFGAFLAAVGVGPTAARLLCRSTTLDRSVSLCLSDRPAFLRTLKQLGVAKLAERQALANAIGKGVRSGLITPERTLRPAVERGGGDGYPQVAVR